MIDFSTCAWSCTVQPLWHRACKPAHKAAHGLSHGFTPTARAYGLAAAWIGPLTVACLHSSVQVSRSCPSADAGVLGSPQPPLGSSHPEARTMPLAAGILSGVAMSSIVTLRKSSHVAPRSSLYRPCLGDLLSTAYAQSGSCCLAVPWDVHVPAK